MLMTNAETPVEKAKEAWLANHVVLFDFLRKLQGKVPDPVIQFEDLLLVFQWSQLGFGAVALWQTEGQEVEVCARVRSGELIFDPDADMIAEEIRLVVMSR